MAHIIYTALAVWFCICSFIVIVAMSLAERIPSEAEEDDRALEPIEGATGAYKEPDHVRAKRLHYLQIRSKIFQASRRERAEHEAAKRGGV